MKNRHIISLALAFLAFFVHPANGADLLETGFEGSSNLPTGWTQSQISGGATWSIQTGGRSGGSNPSTAHSGNNNATLYIANTNVNTTRLISPAFSTDGHTNLSLSFWHTQGLWSPDQDELKVLYSSDGGANWTELEHYTTSVPLWTQRSLALPTASTNSRIAFEGNAKYGYGVCLDDILVTGIPASFSQISVSASDASASEIGPDPGTWTITRSGNTTGALTVNYVLSGNATQGSDYTVNAPSPINFAAGETSKVVTLTPVDDTVGAEGEEIATLTVTAGTGYEINTPSDDISIYDDEGFDLNILVIGSTHSFSDGGEHDVVHEKAFNPTVISTHLKSILTQDPLLGDTVNVVFEDIFKAKTNSVRTSKNGTADITAHCYSLAQHYMWPDGKTDRLSNLRGESGIQWDYIILCSDPYIMANFPGMYAEGVKLIQKEVAQGSAPAQVILMAQWPENSSPFTADNFDEVVHRVGRSAGLTVVPAGKTWHGYTSKDTNTAHPTPKGEYLAAASIYSKLYNRSAKVSGYDFPSDGDNIADHALSVVQADTSASLYSDTYTSINPFQMKYVQKRDYSFRETGTSTEDRLADAWARFDDVARITMLRNSGSFWDFNYGRGNDGWEDDKDYEVDPTKYDRSYGFPMHHYYTGSAANAAAQTMPFGIDKYYYGSTYEDGTDLGIAYNMIRPNTRETSIPADVRAIPIRLLWLKMEQAWPGFNPLGDNTHMHPHLNDASVSFMYTLLTGRCMTVDEPATPGSSAWMEWLGHKTGYETAWQMSHLTTRSPGFKVLPSGTHEDTVTPNTTQTMAVRFMNAPQSNVTVTISSSNPAYANVSPSTLTFTPGNYNTAQEITVSGMTADQGLQEININFSTSSTDKIFNNLTDSWNYTSNTESVTYGQSVLLTGFDGANIANTTSANAGVYKELSMPHTSSTSAGHVNATLSTTDGLVGSFQRPGLYSPSTWGSVAFFPPAETTNSLIMMADNEATISYFIENTGPGDVTLETLHFRLQRDNASGGSADQVTITLVSGDLSSSGPGIQTLSSSNGGQNYDFDLTSMLTDATLAPGESATFTFHVTPSDPLGTNRRVRVDNLAISGIVAAANTGGDTFATWISGYAVGSENGFTDDPDGDGNTNGLENYFGTDPSEFSQGPVATGVSGNTFTFTHPLSDTIAPDITAAYQWTTNLTNYHADGASSAGSTVNCTQSTPVSGIVTVTATVTGTMPDRLFINIKVTQN